GEQRPPQPAKPRQLAIAERGGQTEIRGREPTPGSERYRPLGNVLSGMASVCTLLDPRFEPHPPVFDEAVLLHHDRVGGLGHRGASKDPDGLPARGATAERVTRCGSAANRKHE